MSRLWKNKGSVLMEQQPKKPYSKPILRVLGSHRHSKLIIIDDLSKIDRMKVHNFNKRTWSELDKKELSEALNHDELVELCYRLGNDREYLETRLNNILKNVTGVTIQHETFEEDELKELFKKHLNCDGILLGSDTIKGCSCCVESLKIKTSNDNMKGGHHNDQKKD